ncbi:MAG: hypothetical protein V3V05_08040 [Pontiella sp.]
MKVHRATIEGLIDLYTLCHNIFDEEYNAEKESEDAAMDYMTSPHRLKFCGIVDNLDPEVCRELVALMKLGCDNRSADDFEGLKERAAVHPDTGNDLIGEQLWTC